MEWVDNATPGIITPGKETRCPLYRRLGGPISIQFMFFNVLSHHPDDQFKKQHITQK
jgi:hypothetical protein